MCLIGDSGTGKSHLLIGLGAAAAEAGCRVRYTLASKLVNGLAEAIILHNTGPAGPSPSRSPERRHLPAG